MEDFSIAREKMHWMNAMKYKDQFEFYIEETDIRRLEKGKSLGQNLNKKVHPKGR